MGSQVIRSEAWITTVWPLRLETEKVTVPFLHLKELGSKNSAAGACGSEGTMLAPTDVGGYAAQTASNPRLQVSPSLLRLPDRLGRYSAVNPVPRVSCWRAGPTPQDENLTSSGGEVYSSRYVPGRAGLATTHQLPHPSSRAACPPTRAGPRGEAP